MSGLEIELDEELLQEFHTEVSDIMEGLGDDFMTFEKQINNLPQELIDQIFRGLHTIKGNAGFVGLSGMSKLAHAMEDIFAAVRNGTLQIQRTQMDHIFAGLDTLKEMLNAPMQSNEVDTSTLITAYKAILNGTPLEPKQTSSPAIDSTLEKFLASDDMMERIDLLQKMESDQLTDCIEPLFEFIEHPFDDDPLNVILDSTIKVLLKSKQDAIVNGLSHTGVKVQSLCAQLAGKYQRPDALAPLLKILDTATNQELLRASLKSLGELQNPAALDDLKEFAGSDDPVLAATAVSALGLIQPDFAALQATFDRLPELPALAMLDGMAAEQSATNVGFLVDHIHHPNSVIRRVIASHIKDINEPAIDPLAQKLIKGNRDEKIMSANILAGMNQQRIFPYLVAATREKDENIRFAAYEALGHISSQQTCYTCFEGMFDPSLSIRSLVLNYLEENVCAVVAGKIRRTLQQNDKKAERIREAMAHVAATEILGRLIDHPDIFKPIFSEIKSQSSVLVLEQYRALLLQDRCKDVLKLWNAVSVEAESAYEIKDHKVLVVDDSATILRISSNILNKVGYTTFTAMDGQQGLNILAKQRVDIVITDMNMPVMTGIEMAREMRKNILLESLPLIMITTEQNENEKQAAQDAGVDVFLTKPFKPKELLECIDGLLAP
jgi:CheY-like chemotaxis protein/HEAT repeat protein/HPt (histidine-containing phosphotransfer) domain-containing protein